MTINRNFGIEMELTGLTMNQGLSALQNAGLTACIEGYNHDTRPHWKIVTDASVQGGFEVVSPILRGDAGLAEAERAADALKRAGARINKTCGLHVHFAADNLSVDAIRTIAVRYATFEGEIDAFMPHSRRANTNYFCRSTRQIFLNNRDFSSAATITDLARAQGSRYFKLNLQSYTRHKTIEFRQHSGTVEAAKIRNWILFLNAFINESCRLAGTHSPELARSLPNLQSAQARLVSMLEGEGASADSLQNALNLLPHSLRAAISYLRRAGVAVESRRRNGETRYRIASHAMRTAADSLFAGIDESVRDFYLNRAAALA